MLRRRLIFLVAQARLKPATEDSTYLHPMPAICNAAPLKGLVLAGGYSTRMALDKSTIDWHGKQQRYHVADLLANFCTDVFISCRHEQATNVEPMYQVLPDPFAEIGPMSGLLAAFAADGQSAWLVVACDLPLLDEATISFLVQSRDNKKFATAFCSPDDGLPEPMLAIWEPACHALVGQAHQRGAYSLRKMLLNADARLLHAPDPQALLNANTPEDAADVRRIIGLRNG